MATEVDLTRDQLAERNALELEKLRAEAAKLNADRQWMAFIPMTISLVALAVALLR